MSSNTPPAFKGLEIHDWRQFDGVEIQFADTLTVLTGANASGKSTILKRVLHLSAVVWADLSRFATGWRGLSRL